MKKMKRILGLVLTVCFAVGLMAGFTASPASALTYENLSFANVGITQAVADASLLSMGDSTRMARVMAKAAAGQEITIAFIGGSITYGSGVRESGSLDERFSNLVYGWFQETFPNATINHINCGVPETGSLIGVFRAEDAMWQYEPDLVVIEFAVNDAAAWSTSESTEALVRTALAMDNDPAVMLLMMCTGSGWNSQEAKAEIGYHYGLPMVSWADGIQYCVDHGIATRKSFDADGTHPNAKGNAACALFIINWLETVYANYASTAQNAVPPIASVMFSDDLSHVAARYNFNFTPTNLGSWNECSDASKYSEFSQGWKITNGGTEAMTFEVEAKRIYIPYMLGPTYDGKVGVSINGVPTAYLTSSGGNAYNKQGFAEVMDLDTTKRVSVSIQMVAGTRFAISGIWLAY